MTHRKIALGLATLAATMLSLSAVGCGDSETKAATQLLVTISAESGVEKRVHRLIAYVAPSGASERDDSVQVHEFSLTPGRAHGVAVSWPFSFGVARGSTDNVLLVVEGFSDAAGSAPVIEHKRPARFREGTTRELRIELQDACVDKVCNGLQSTCSTQSGGCVDVQSGSPAARAEWIDDSDMDAGHKDQGVSSVMPTQAPEIIADAGGTRREAENRDAAAPEVHEDPDEADGGAIEPSVCARPNSCTSQHYPCAETDNGGYVCRGQFIASPMPDAHEGAKTPPALDYTSKPDVVVDRVTQLEWQRHVSTTLAGCSGNENTPGDTCTWEEAKNYCRQLDLAGGGWRLPSKIEIESIFGDTQFRPPVDVAAFPDLAVKHVFWTASPAANQGSTAWVARSGLGFTLFEETTMQRNVRCVRGGAKPRGTPNDHYFRQLAADSIIDTYTTLEWQRGYSDVESIEAAREFCDSQTGGWRLPGLNELLSLIDPTRSEPAIDPVFPALPLGGMFWSATPMIPLPDPEPDGARQYMVVDFSGGVAGGDGLLRDTQQTVRYTFHARCVR